MRALPVFATRLCLAATLLLATAVTHLPTPASAQACLECPSYFVSSSARSGVNLRADPSTRGQVLGGIPPGAIVRYLGQTQADRAGRAWMNVVYQEKRGWVIERVLNAAAAPQSGGSLTTTPRALSTTPSSASAVVAAPTLSPLSTTNTAQATPQGLPSVSVEVDTGSANATQSSNGLASFQPVAPLALLPLDQLAPLVVPDPPAAAPAATVASGAEAVAVTAAASQSATATASSTTNILVAPTPNATPALAPLKTDLAGTGTASVTTTGTKAPTVAPLTEQRATESGTASTGLTEEQFVARPLTGGVQQVPRTRTVARTVTRDVAVPAEGGGSGGLLITGSNIAIYSQPGLAFSTSRNLRRNAIVSRTGEEATDSGGRKWVRVSGDGGNGWVEDSRLRSSTARVVGGDSGTATSRTETSTRNETIPLRYRLNGVVNGLRMRSAPGTQFATIATVPSNARNIVPLGEQFKGWVYVRHGRNSGWVSAQFLAPVN